MSSINYEFSVKDVIVIFVIMVFQYQLASITKQLNAIENTMIQELIEMKEVKMVNAQQTKDIEFLRKALADHEDDNEGHN